MIGPGETYCGGCEECREGNERWCCSPVPVTKEQDDRRRELAQKDEPLTRAEREELARINGFPLPSPEVEAEQVALTQKILHEILEEEKLDRALDRLW